MDEYEYERDGAEIYRRSFATIRGETDLTGLPADVARVAVRMVHACGQVDLVEDLAYSPGVVARARVALDAGAPVLCDAEMVAAGEFGRYVGGDGCQPEDTDVEHLPRFLRRFKILAGEGAKSQIDALAGHGLPDHVRMPLDLIADGGPDEVGAVGVEPFLHQEIDVAEVHVAEIDRDLLAVGRLRSDVSYVAGHLISILSPSAWMVIGADPDVLQAETVLPHEECSHVLGVRECKQVS